MIDPESTPGSPAASDNALPIADSNGEIRWAWLVGFGVMLLTLLPYLWGMMIAGARPSLGVYSWFTFNATDHCVYLSWMRQAAEGHFFQQNLFTTDPQGGHQFNLFFLALGTIARITHLSTICVYQIARFVLGVIFLRAAYWLLQLLLSDLRARRTAFMVMAFSAGLGWIPGLWEMGLVRGPVDTWQPEAITFLSLYLFPLFIVSLLLMVGVLGWLLTAERTGSYRHAAYAGVCGLLLGNIHSYDVITLTAIWGGYLTIRGIARRKFEAASWGRAIVAGALTAISTGYMAYLLKTETVFAKRAAVPTLSPPISMYVLGFGLIFALALIGILSRSAIPYFRSNPVLSALEGATAIPAAESDKATTQSPDSRLFLIVWFVANLVVAYLPLAFQRKMVMGVHLPLSILAGIGLLSIVNSIKGSARFLVTATAILVMSLTNLRFVMKNVGELSENQGPVRTYMYTGELAALNWIREHAPAGVPVQPLPWIAINPSNGRLGFFDNTVACFTPGLTGHPVNAGHWGETPDFGKTMNLWAIFQRPDTTDDWRRNLLQTTGVRYIIFSQKHDETHDPAVESSLPTVFRGTPPNYLRAVPEASNSDADVYEVIL